MVLAQGAHLPLLVRAALTAAFLAVQVGISAAPAAAQRIEGVVRETGTTRGVAFARITLQAADSSTLGMALTDSTGRFTVGVAVRDTVLLLVESLGFAPVRSVPIVVGAADTLRLEIGLRPDPLQLPALQAEVVNANLSGFLRRRATRRFGEFLDWEEIRRLAPRTADELLAHTEAIDPSFEPGAGVVGRFGSDGFRRLIYSCKPFVFVDGRDMEPWRQALGPRPKAFEMKVVSARIAPPEDPVSLDAWVDVRSIVAVEVYASPFDAPWQFRRPGCASILVWTDAGFGLRPRRARSPASR